MKMFRRLLLMCSLFLAITAKAQAALPIQHVVVIVQENRTVDNLFHSLSGANVVNSGQDSNGNTITLQPIDITAPWDIPHGHRNWLSDCNAISNVCQMNGFDSEACGCTTLDPAYGFVPQNEVEPYYLMAESYTFGDGALQTNQGPSFVAHCYLVSGTCTQFDGAGLIAAENPNGPSPGGCDSMVGTTVQMINPKGNEGTRLFPCFTRTSIFTRLDAAKISWRFYQANQGAGLWNSVDALKNYCPVTPCNSNKEFSTHVISPPSQILTDIANNQLAAVSFVTPTAAASDHAGQTDGSGPSWVADVIDAIGENSNYWNNTVIIVTWDDWGGWYDHVVPPIRTSNELGFRVPMVFVSAYSEGGNIVHDNYETLGSTLKFIEEVFNIPTLGTTDLNAPPIDDAFNFNSAPAAFKPITAPLSPMFFQHLPLDTRIPDAD